VTTTSETKNQAGEVVQRFVAKLIAFTREFSEAQEAARAQGQGQAQI
jgi:hypothetical protein